MTALVARALQPLDGARGLVLRALGDIAPVRRLMVGRGTRVPILLSLHAVAAFGIALLVPSFSLVFSPILLGVPHVASDVRHLVLRRALPAWWLRAIWVFAACLIGLRLLGATHVLSAAPLIVEHIVGSGWLLVGALGGAIIGGWRRTAPWVLVVAATVAVGSVVEPRIFRLGFLHGHNLLAIPIWLFLFRRGSRLCSSLFWLPVGLILIGGALLGSGVLLRFAVRHGVLSLFGLHLFAAADWIAPGLPDAWAIAITMSFAFLQSVHYAIWLVAIPQDDGRAQGSLTFQMSWRSLARDLTEPGLKIVAGLALLVGGAGVLSPVRTGTVLLSLATFHAWLELALLAFFVARDGLGFRRPAGVAA